MAFLIPDNLKSRADVPAGIQGVASAFQVGLDDNVVVWYEPLYDPSGDKPHLVILLPTRGIIVLEVLEVKAESLLGSLRGRIRLERDGREIEVENPLLRAERFATVLRQRIVAEPRLSGLPIAVGAGAVLGSLTVEEADRKGVARILALERCLLRTDLKAATDGIGEAGLLRAFGRMLGGSAGDSIPADQEKILRGLIQPETVIGRVARTASPSQLTIFRPPEGEEDIIRVMDRQQEAFAKSLGEGHRIIRGVAGSGKTLILVYRARLLAQLLPQRRFLVTCYTRSLAGQLRALLSEHDNVDVIHLDRVMADTIRAAGMQHPGFEEDPEGEKVAQIALEALQRSASPRYRAVLLDEAQDFGTDALRFVVGLLEPGCDDLVIVADAAQNIFRREFSWRQAGIQAQGRTRILRKNYRNTKEILEFASRFLLASADLRPDEIPDPEDEHAVIPPESCARNGPRPLLHVVEDLRAEITQVIEQVSTWVVPAAQPRTLAVLYASSRDNGIERARGLYDGLRTAGVHVFWLNDPHDRDARERLAETTAPVILSTIHSAKGLEFPHVVLCGIWREGEDPEVNRKLAYVGMTRATDYLAVVTMNDHPLVPDLQMAIVSQYPDRYR